MTTFIILAFGSHLFRNGNPKIGGTPIKSNENKVKQSASKIKKQRSANNKDLDLFKRYMTLVNESNQLMKSGSVIAKLIEGFSSTVTEKNNSLLSFYNQNVNLKDVKFYVTRCQLGTSYSNQIRRIKQGPTYETFQKHILSTRSDALSTGGRQNLKATAGCNQRVFCFLDDKTFLTINDILHLTGFDRPNVKEFKTMQSKVSQQINYKKDEIIKNLLNNTQIPKPVVEGVMKAKDRKKQEPTKESKVVKYYSTLLETIFTLKITNVMLVHNTTIAIHLVKFKENSIAVNEATINDIINHVTYSTPATEWSDELTERGYLHYEKIPYQSVKQVGKYNGYTKNFVTTLDVNLTQNESFLDRVEVLNTWRRTLGPRCEWKFELNEIFKHGIYLNKIYEYNHDSSFKRNTPISCFFIIEAFGDRRSTIIRLEDNEIFPGSYSPVSLQMEMEFSYKHLAKPSESDKIHYYELISKNNEFEDEEESELFYPDREQKFNVNFDEIIIDSIAGRKTTKGKKYRLEMGDDSYKSENKLESLLDKLGSLLPQKEKDNLTEDDLPFIDVNGENDQILNTDDDQEEEFDSPADINFD